MQSKENSFDQRTNCFIPRLYIFIRFFWNNIINFIFEVHICSRARVELHALAGMLKEPLSTFEKEAKSCENISYINITMSFISFRLSFISRRVCENIAYRYHGMCRSFNFRELGSEFQRLSESLNRRFSCIFCSWLYIDDIQIDSNSIVCNKVKTFMEKFTIFFTRFHYQVHLKTQVNHGRLWFIQWSSSKSFWHSTFRFLLVLLQYF